MLHFHGLMGFAWLTGVNARAGLDAGLFVGGQHKFIFPEWLSLPDSLIKVQKTARFGGKVRIARENPAAVLPGAKSVGVKPSPDGGVADAGHQTGLDGVAANLGRAPAGEGNLTQAGQFAGQGFNLHHNFWGEKTGGDPVGEVPPSQPGVR